MKMYVERNYSATRKEWATCYRKQAPFTASNHAESWHSALKNMLLSKKQNSRLDSTLFALLQHPRDRDIQLASMVVALNSSSPHFYNRKFQFNVSEGISLDVKVVVLNSTRMLHLLQG